MWHKENESTQFDAMLQALNSSTCKPAVVELSTGETKGTVLVQLAGDDQKRHVFEHRGKIRLGVLNPTQLRHVKALLDVTHPELEWVNPSQGLVGLSLEQPSPQTFKRWLLEALEENLKDNLPFMFNKSFQGVPEQVVKTLAYVWFFQNGYDPVIELRALQPRLLELLHEVQHDAVLIETAQHTLRPLSIDDFSQPTPTERTLLTTALNQKETPTVGLVPRELVKQRIGHHLLHTLKFMQVKRYL